MIYTTGTILYVMDSFTIGSDNINRLIARKSVND